MRRDDALPILRAHRRELAALGVSRLALFGLLARDEAASESDIDLLVAFDRPVGLIAFIRLQERLEAILGRPVDLVAEAAFKHQLRASILSEAIDAA